VAEIPRNVSYELHVSSFVSADSLRLQWKYVTSSAVGADDNDDIDIVMSDADRQVSLPPPQPQQPLLLVQIKAHYVSPTPQQARSPV